MAAWTLAEAKAKLDEWKLAETKVAEGQAYSIAGRMMTRANLGEISQTILFYTNLVTKLERGGIRIRQGVPL
jgi:hypothetical protein